MPGRDKLTRRELLMLWRRPAPDRKDAALGPSAEAATRVPAPASPGDRWPRDRIPGPSFGRELPLRPPGNMQEYLLREACTRCGLCVEACPAEAIVPLDATWGAAAGTPMIDARRQPCVLCETLACTQACPSGALQLLAGRPTVDPTRCVGCGLCVRPCPTEPASIAVVPRD